MARRQELNQLLFESDVLILEVAFDCDGNQESVLTGRADAVEDYYDELAQGIPRDFEGDSSNNTIQNL